MDWRQFWILIWEYSKYDYKNKDNNNRNGYSHKKLCINFGDIGVSVPRDRTDDLSHRYKKTA